jgi:hypothetical protein
MSPCCESVPKRSSGDGDWNEVPKRSFRASPSTIR